MSAGIVVMGLLLDAAAPPTHAPQLGDAGEGERLRGALGFHRAQRLAPRLARIVSTFASSFSTAASSRSIASRGAGATNSVWAPSPWKGEGRMAAGHPGWGELARSGAPPSRPLRGRPPPSRGRWRPAGAHPPARRAYRRREPARRSEPSGRTQGRSAGPGARGRNCGCRGRPRSTSCFAALSRCAASPRRGIPACSSSPAPVLLANGSASGGGGACLTGRAADLGTAVFQRGSRISSGPVCHAPSSCAALAGAAGFLRGADLGGRGRARSRRRARGRAPRV